MWAVQEAEELPEPLAEFAVVVVPRAPEVRAIGREALVSAVSPPEGRTPLEPVVSRAARRSLKTTVLGLGVRAEAQTQRTAPLALERPP